MIQPSGCILLFKEDACATRFYCFLFNVTWLQPVRMIILDDKTIDRGTFLLQLTMQEWDWICLKHHVRSGLTMFCALLLKGILFQSASYILLTGQLLTHNINITPPEHQHPAISVHWRHLTPSPAVAHYSFTVLQPCLTLAEWIQSQLDSCRHHGHVVVLFILFLWSLLGGVFCGLLSQVSVTVLTQYSLYPLKIRTVCSCRCKEHVCSFLIHSRWFFIVKTYKDKVYPKYKHN